MGTGNLVTQFKQLRLLIPVVRLLLCPVQTYEHHLSCHQAPSSSPAFLKTFDGDIKPITYDGLGSKLHCVLAYPGQDPSKYSTHSLRLGGASYAFSVAPLSSSSTSRKSGRLTQSLSGQAHCFEQCMSPLLILFWSPSPVFEHSFLSYGLGVPLRLPPPPLDVALVFPENNKGYLRYCI